MKKPFLTHSICVLGIATSGLLTACASLPNHSPVSNDNAQTALANAISKQMRHSFDFQSDIYLSNQIRENALANATEEQLNASEDKMSLCEDQHDKAFVALAKSQLKQGVTLDEIDTDKPEFMAIRDEYQDCVAKRDGDEKLALPDADEFLQGVADKSPNEQMDLLWQAYQDTLEQHESQIAENKAAYLADYDGNHTALDRKKAQLFKEYALKPSKLSISGNYRPLSGQVSLLPVFAYNRKNLELFLAQPVHIDVRQGVLYVWADALAAINSETIDKQLGDKWHQKWLAIPLNDGSLPQDFAQNLFKFIINAKKQSHASLPASAFAWVQADQVLGVPYLSQNLPQQALTKIQQSPKIIRSQPDLMAREYARYLFADSLYQDIVRAYPQFSQEFAMQNRQIVDGEYHIEVSTEQSTTEPQREAKLSSRMLIDVLLVSLQNISHSYQARISAGEISQPVDENFVPMTHFGMTNDRIGWVHQRHYLKKTKLQGGQLHTATNNQLMFVDSFTVIDNQSNQSVFKNLPTTAQMPNAQNSVNLLEYGNHLAKSVQAGENNYLKTLFTLIFGAEESDVIELDEPQANP